MARCKHENADHLMPGQWLTLVDDLGEHPIHVVQCEQFRCIECEAWLSLGPSNDADPNVQVEIEAARLAALHRDGRRIPHNGTRGRGTATGCAGCGWNLEHRSAPLLDGKRNTDAGYLARCIAQHDEEQG